MKDTKTYLTGFSFFAWVMPQEWDFGALGARGSNFFFFQTWSCGTSNRGGWRAEQNASKSFILRSNWWPWAEVKRSNIIKFRLHCQILRFLYQTLCAFLQIKDRKHIEQNFHSVAGVMPQGWDLGVLGRSFTWGFAMVPHRLHILVYFSFIEHVPVGFWYTFITQSKSDKMR